MTLTKVYYHKQHGVMSPNILSDNESAKNVLYIEKDPDVSN